MLILQKKQSPSHYRFQIFERSWFLLGMAMTSLLAILTVGCSSSSKSSDSTISPFDNNGRQWRYFAREIYFPSDQFIDPNVNVAQESVKAALNTLADDTDLGNGYFIFKTSREYEIQPSSYTDSHWRSFIQILPDDLFSVVQKEAKFLMTTGDPLGVIRIHPNNSREMQLYMHLDCFTSGPKCFFASPFQAKMYVYRLMGELIGLPSGVAAQNDIMKYKIANLSAADEAAVKALYYSQFNAALGAYKNKEAIDQVKNPALYFDRKIFFPNGTVSAEALLAQEIIKSALMDLETSSDIGRGYFEIDYVESSTLESYSTETKVEGRPWRSFYHLWDDETFNSYLTARAEEGSLSLDEDTLVVLNALSSAPTQYYIISRLSCFTGEIGCAYPSQEEAKALVLRSYGYLMGLSPEKSSKVMSPGVSAAQVSAVERRKFFATFNNVLENFRLKIGSFEGK